MTVYPAYIQLYSPKDAFIMTTGAFSLLGKAIISVDPQYFELKHSAVTALVINHRISSKFATIFQPLNGYITTGAYPSEEEESSVFREQRRGLTYPLALIQSG